MLLHTGGDSLTHLPHPDFTLDFAQQHPLFVCVRRLCSCDPMLISYSIHTYLILFACVSRICGTRMFLYYLSVIKYYLSLIIRLDTFKNNAEHAGKQCGIGWELMRNALENNVG